MKFTKIKTNNTIKTLVFATSLLIATSCSKDDDNVVPVDAALQEVQRISVSAGNTSSNTVIVHMQGGPVYEFGDSEIIEIMNSTETANAHWINVHQVQTINPARFQNADITFDQAKLEVIETTDNVHKVVQYYKGEGKNVKLVGTSYGAFIAIDYIARYGTASVDKFLIAAGRLDMDDEIWTSFSQGNNGGFQYNTDGTYTVITQDETNVADKNLNRLAAGLGHKRYTQVLANVSSLEKVFYVYGSRDTATGTLSTNEIAFLQSKNATVAWIENGGHDDAIGGAIGSLKTVFNLN